MTNTAQLPEWPKVRGYCPMGCGQTIFVGQDGWLTCSYARCADPAALASILDDRSLLEWLAGSRPTCIPEVSA